MGFYEEMIRRIAADADPAACVEEIRIYANWVLVKTGKWSISTYFHGMPGFTDPAGMGTWMGDWIGRPARAAALELLVSREILKRSVGMACLKSLLPDPPATIAGGAIELVEPAACRIPTCFIGYFKTAAAWREKGYPVTIVELFPRPGDIHWNEADEVLEKAELVLMTGLTVVNETLEAVIRRTPSARMRIIMGPTVPASPVLFDYGIDMLGITQIDDVELMSNYALLGGGSIANAPAGALRSLNMARDLRALQERISALAR
ncbi:DUF364 domain-containing protein [Syntrophus aciditrophicus]|uniref:Hypothetical cytosolic protein n=1 Tax=Syntrophus aciditrophicus (strain SB) TaxID=56780 RepID=Q2LX32_SYNAS|nr:DUF364 domain-containing protein [Syntrophus aciditrophicus]ABC78640.1 hypothetical cytosolic protein [Syntrophus aciditrophicus SB]OPY16812.1 MAG: hypothetical protein A4E74_01631 [Syntrophus sp. PtaB.Bin075]